jgi:hypothetical protein
MIQDNLTNGTLGITSYNGLIPAPVALVAVIISSDLSFVSIPIAFVVVPRPLNY